MRSLRLIYGWSILRRLLLICFYAGLGLQTRASSIDQEYTISTWKTKDGLPQNSITSIAQTPDGYLWLGSFLGLARFDGLKFMVVNAQQATAFRYSSIDNLTVDARGRLWIADHFGGLNFLEYGSFHRAGFPANTFGMIDSVLETGDQNLLAASGSGIFRWTGEQFVKCEAPELDNSLQKLLAKDNKGQVWIYTDGALCKLKTDQGRHWTIDGERRKISLFAFSAAKKGGFWIATEYGIERIDDSLETKEIVSIPWQRTLWDASIVEDRNGTIWVGSAVDGVWRVTFNADGKGIAEPAGYQGQRVISLFADQNDCLWIGLDGGGLVRYRPRIFKTAGLREPIRGIHRGKGGTWYTSSTSGVLKIDDEGRGLSHDGLLKGYYPWMVFNDDQKRLWIGTHSEGLWCFDERDNRLLFHRTDLLGKNIVCCTPAPDGTLWFGGTHGLFHFRDNDFVHYTNKDGLSVSDVRCLAFDNKGTLWIGTHAHLSEYRNGKFSAWYIPESIRAQSIFALLCDEQGAVWCGTQGGGLLRFKEGAFTQVLPGRIKANINAIVEDQLGYYWLASTHGLQRISKQELNKALDSRSTEIQIKEYSEQDGLPNSEFTGSVQPNVVSGEDGKLWFCTLEGLAVVDPGVLHTNTRPPNVLIEQVRSPEGVAWSSLRHQVESRLKEQDASELVFPPGTERLEVEYTGVNLISPKDVRFRYRLAPLEKDWLDAEKRRVAYYTSLSPGSYSFEVLASNEDGIWNTAPATLSFIVKPFFWQTKLFAAGTGMVLAGIVGITVRQVSLRKLRQRMRELEREQAVERERSRIAKDMHDHLGSDLTRVSLLSELVKRDLRQPEKAEEHAGKILKTVNELVQGMDEIVWATNPEKDTLKNLQSYLSAYADNFFEGSEIRFRMDWPARCPDVSLSSQHRHNLFLIIKEGLNNALKHSGATLIRFEAVFEKNFGVFTISDDGKGFDVSEVDAEGNGLRNMARRVKDFGGKLEIKSKIGRGTTLKIVFPFSGSRESLSHDHATR